MAWPPAFLGIARILRSPALWLARHGGFFVEVEHVGRRSGRRFITPVRAVVRGDQVVMGASFGLASDWVRNVLAADGCRIRTRQRVMDLRDPQIVPLAEALPLLPPATRFILRRLARAEECLVLQVG